MGTEQARLPPFSPCILCFAPLIWGFKEKHARDFKSWDEFRSRLCPKHVIRGAHTTKLVPRVFLNNTQDNSPLETGFKSRFCAKHALNGGAHTAKMYNGEIFPQEMHRLASRTLPFLCRKKTPSKIVGVWRVLSDLTCTCSKFFNCLIKTLEHWHTKPLAYTATSTVVQGAYIQDAYYLTCRETSTREKVMRLIFQHENNKPRSISC